VTNSQYYFSWKWTWVHLTCDCCLKCYYCPFSALAKS